MKILILQAKYQDYAVCARTPEEELLAYMHLFKLMDKYGFYSGTLSGDQIEWYREAILGNKQAARQLLQYRSDERYEYEEIEKIEALELA